MALCLRYAMANALRAIPVRSLGEVPVSTSLINPPFSIPTENSVQPAALVMPPVADGSFVPVSSLRRGATVWGMVGDSDALRKLQERIRSAATSDLSVLII